MSINKIYGNQVVAPLAGVKSAAKSNTAGKTGSVGDQVSFSDVMQQVSQAKDTAPAQSSERADKIAALKAQVADGTYQPDLQKVASSLVKFLVEGR